MAIINDRTAVTTPVTVDALFATAIGTAAATKATFAEMGGLEIDEQTPSANITGAVGKHYVITTTSMSGNIDVTVPSASVGERMRVTCVTDEPDHAIVIKGAASQTINGGSAATEWSRLMSRGETVQLVCTAANTWWVEHDGRLPHVALWRDTWTSTDNTTYHLIDLGGTPDYQFERGITIDTTNDYWTVRRAGNYEVHHKSALASMVTSTYMLPAIYLNTVSVEYSSMSNKYGTLAHGCTVMTTLTGLVVGDDIEARLRHNDSTSETVNTAVAIKEILDA